jgi:hypothetical protein
MTCNTCGGWGDYPVAGPYPELTITHEPCPECESLKEEQRLQREADKRIERYLAVKQ